MANKVTGVIHRDETQARKARRDRERAEKGIIPVAQFDAFWAEVVPDCDAQLDDLVRHYLRYNFFVEANDAHAYTYEHLYRFSACLKDRYMRMAARHGNFHPSLTRGPRP